VLFAEAIKCVISSAALALMFYRGQEKDIGQLNLKTGEHTYSMCWNNCASNAEDR
jgi:hypothetical protein